MLKRILREMHSKSTILSWQKLEIWIMPSVARETGMQEASWGSKMGWPLQRTVWPGVSKLNIHIYTLCPGKCIPKKILKPEIYKDIYCSVVCKGGSRWQLGRQAIR